MRISPVGLEIFAHADDFRRLVDVSAHKQIRARNELDDECCILDAVCSHVLCAVEYPIARFAVFLRADDIGIILAFVVFYGISCHEDEFLFCYKFLEQIVSRVVGMLMGMVTAVNEIGQRLQIFVGQIEFETTTVFAGIFPFDAAVDIERENLSAFFHENARTI